MPANANSGRSWLSANQTTSFFFVSGFGSGAYSAKLLAGTKHRFSGLSHPRQCGGDVLRMFVTGGPPVPALSEVADRPSAAADFCNKIDPNRTLTLAAPSRGRC